MSKDQIVIAIPLILIFVLSYFYIKNSESDSILSSANSKFSIKNNSFSSADNLDNSFTDNLALKKKTAGSIKNELIIGSDHAKGFPADFNLVILRPVTLEPSMFSRSTNIADTADIHLELDARSAIPKANEQSFGIPAGHFIPYLSVSYSVLYHGDDSTFAEIKSDAAVTGDLMPMVASDGLHYGANIKLQGTGYYSVSAQISSPVQNGLVMHTDSTGAGRVWIDSLNVVGRFHYTPGMFVSEK